MSIKQSDKEAEAVATDIRVSLDMIEGQIAHVWYTTADQCITTRATLRDIEALKVLSICFVLMKNGFVVMGKSAPAAPKNFNPELGRKFAYEDCIRQLWPLLGYELKSYIVIRDAAKKLDETVPE